MLELLNLEAPVALWIVVGVVLEDEAEGLSVSRVASRVEVLTAGRFRRRASIGEVLARMRDEGLCDGRRRRTARSLAEHIHTLTPRGRALVDEARADVARILKLAAEGKTNALPQE